MVAWNCYYSQPFIPSCDRPAAYRHRLLLTQLCLSYDGDEQLPQSIEKKALSLASKFDETASFFSMTVNSNMELHRIEDSSMSERNYQICPSILAADFNCLGEQIQILERNQIELLHIDVMDGMFVPSISFGMPLIASIRKESKLFFDVHLMVEEPARYVEEFVKAGADSITVHVEACRDVGATLDKIKSLGVECAISLNPETSAESALPYLSMVDMVLVMSVRPGFGGQKLIPESLDKVAYLAQVRDEQGLDYAIEVDGGVTHDNLDEVVSAGVDIVVAGTAVFRGDIAENVKIMRR